MTRLVSGRFRIVRHARAGGMGNIYHADDTVTGSPVALKLLSTSTPEIVERFLREAEIIAELDHPAIVRHVAHGTPDDAYLVMEWLAGETLADRLVTGPLGVADTLALGARIAGALGAAHARGIVHRDVKPGNIMLVDGEVRRAVLLDFGIAHVLEAGAELTRPGDLLGTPGYIAPEQASGPKVDARADVFALGCVLFRCLAGEPPFPGKDALASAIKLLLEDAPRVGSKARVPAAVDELVARMLARDRDERPSNGAEVERALAAIVGGDEPTRDAGRAPTLTHAERRVVSLVVARRPDGEPTLARIVAVREVLEEALATFGAEVDVLVDGTVVVSVNGGAPNDAASRAARCALAVHAELPNAFVVVTTGHGVIAAGAPASELVDRAIAMLEAEPNGSEPRVVVDTLTAGLLGGRFDLDVGTHGTSLRGESGRRSRTLLGKPTPFVGRAREMATLDAALEECIAEPVARALVVTAKPGVGKSRLRDEYVERVRARGDVRLVVATADPVTTGAAFGVVAELARDLFGLAPSDPAARRARKLAAALEALGMNGSDAGELLGELVGVPFDARENEGLLAARRDPQLLAARLRAAVIALFVATCRAGPTLIAVDDLQWADPASVRLLDELLAAAADLPLFVLALARPEALTTFPSLFADRGTQTLRLLDLTKRASVGLVQTVLGPAVSPETVDTIVARAQGNAFFLEELIRASAEGRSALPETLVAMLDARLAELPAFERRVMRAAAVFGDAASSAEVHALVGGDEAAVARALDALAIGELLTRAPSHGEPRAAARFVFRHALVREAAYAMLTEEDRRVGHRLAAEHLERSGSAEAIVLAKHFASGGDDARASIHFRRASELALARNDLDATIAHAQKAIELGATGEALGVARLLEGEALVWKNAPGGLAAALDALLLVPSRTARWYRAAAGLVHVSGQAGDAVALMRAVTLLREAPAAERDTAVASAEAFALALATWMLALVGAYDLARELAARVNASASEGRLDASGRGWRATTDFFIAKYADGRLCRPLDLADEAIAHFVRASDLRFVIIARLIGAGQRVQLGLYEDAAAEVAATLALCRETRTTTTLPDCWRTLASASEGMGRLEEALEHADAALRGYVDRAVYAEVSRAHGGWVLARLGKTEEGARRVRAAAEGLSAMPSQLVEALAWLSRIESMRGRFDEALAVARRADAVVEGIGSVGFGEASRHVAAITALRGLGLEAEARARAASARRWLADQVSEVADARVRDAFVTRVSEHVVLLLGAADDRR